MWFFVSSFWLYVFFFFFFKQKTAYEIGLGIPAEPLFRSILNTFLFGVIILIANILKRAFSSQLAAKLRNRLLDRKSGSAGMPRPISYAVFCLKKKSRTEPTRLLPARITPSEPPPAFYRPVPHIYLEYS